MKQVMIDKHNQLIEEPLKLWELNWYLSHSKQRRTERISIIANDNHFVIREIYDQRITKI